MLARKIKYTNLNGEERERTYYFHFSKAEVMEMELSKEGGFEVFIQRIIDTRDQKELVKMFRELIQMSYGIKSDDGEQFIKNDQVLNEFIQSEAYSELYMELATDTDAAIEFINGIFPQQIMAEVQNDPEYQKKIAEYKQMISKEKKPE